MKKNIERKKYEKKLKNKNFCLVSQRKNIEEKNAKKYIRGFQQKTNVLIKIGKKIYKEKFTKF